jgi:hypothetical protein
LQASLALPTFDFWLVLQKEHEKWAYETDRPEVFLSYMASQMPN